MTMTDDFVAPSVGAEQVRCGAPTRSGVPCASPVVLESGFCISHDPDRSDDMAVFRHMGGKATSLEAQAERALLKSGDLGAVAHALTSSIAELRGDGPIGPNQGNAIATLARAYLQVREQALNERRMERMLKTLEDKLAGVVDVEAWGDDED